MTEPIKPGDSTGTPNPAAQVNPAAPGQAQTPQPGVTPVDPKAPVTPATPEVTPAAGTPPVEQGTVPLQALQEERVKRQALQQELEQVRQQVQQGNSQTTYEPSQAAAQPAQQAQDQQRDHINRLWETDPREAVKAEISNSLTHYDNVNASVEAQANQLSGKYADFNNYRSQAMNYIRTLPYDQRAQNGIVELAYMVARGQNVDTLVQTRETELMEKFKNGQLAGSLHQPAGAGGQPQIPAGDITLTPDQAAAANAMNMTPADYAANMKA